MPTVNRSAAIWCYPLIFLLLSVSSQSQASRPAQANPATAGKFSDVTNSLGIHFQYQAEHTSKKYLLETMGPGVALFGYTITMASSDIFLVNGAPITAPMPKDAIPQKTGPEYWNRLYHQEPDGPFKECYPTCRRSGCPNGMGAQAVGRLRQRTGMNLLHAAYGGFYLETVLRCDNGECTVSVVVIERLYPYRCACWVALPMCRLATAWALL